MFLDTGHGHHDRPQNETMADRGKSLVFLRYGQSSRQEGEV